MIQCFQINKIEVGGGEKEGNIEMKGDLIDKSTKLNDWTCLDPYLEKNQLFKK